MMSVSKSPSTFFLFNIFVTWSLLLSHRIVAFSLNSEGEVLLSLLNKFSFESPDSIKLNWNLSSSTPCDWSGIGCNTEKTHVVSLNLSYQEISGQLGPQIGQLWYLKSVDLSENNFNGSIPTELWNCSHLQHLHLSWNRFSGELPEAVRNLHQLKSFDISNNRLLRGGIPKSLCQISGLKYIDFSINNFTGSIPTELWNCSHLQYLDLSGNNFIGELPDAVKNLHQLKSFYMNDNYLSGRIPESLFQISGLESITLGLNNFNGSIPFNIGNATNMKLCMLAMNQIHGIIPISIANCSKLENLNLRKNGLNGEIPFELWRILTLVSIRVDDNNLSGELPVEMTDLRHLEIISLSGNQFSGLIPKVLGINSSSLYIVDFSNNTFSGEVPPNLCFGKNMVVLDLSENQMNGTLSPCLSTYLEKLKLRNNNFSGTIPLNFTGDALSTLDLNGNRLEGEIPISLGINSPSLRSLDLGNNQLNDTFPFFLEILSDLQILVLRANKLHGPLNRPHTSLAFNNLRILDISNNYFTGNLPVEFFLALYATRHIDSVKDIVNGSFPISIYYYSEISSVVIHKGKEMKLNTTLMTSFRAIDMSNNRFQGKIPESIGELLLLKMLNFSNNDLNGSIPSSLGNLTQLESLDLSKNKLFGEIPWQLTNLNFLAALNLSHNNLTGRIPNAGQFQTFSNDSFHGNPGLCGYQSLSGCVNDADKESRRDPVEEKETHEDSKSWNFGWEPVVIGYGCGVLIGLVIQYFIFTKASMYRWFG